MSVSAAHSTPVDRLRRDNTRLRKENQALRARVAVLTRRRDHWRVEAKRWREYWL